MESCYSGLVVRIGILETSVLSNEVGHGQHAAHPSGVIAKEDTAKGSEGADEISFEGDGSFDTRGVGGPSDDNSSSRHVCGIAMALVFVRCKPSQ